MRIALDSRAMGKVIRAYRLHPAHGRRPLPQDLVATWVGITQAQLSRIENGPPIVHLDRLIQWALVLGVPESRLWFRLPADDSTSLGLQRTTLVDLTEGPSESEGEFLPEEFPDPSPEDDLEKAVAQEARLTARFTHLITRSSVEPIALEQVSADIRSLARSFISIPLADLFGDIRDLRREVAAAVTCNKYPNQLRDLYLASSRLSGLMAHICLDLGDYSSADTHARASWLSADLAGHTQMQAWARALQSLVAYWDERYDDAVNTAEDGLQRTHDGTVVVRLRGLQARAHARSRNQTAALAALKAAEAARDQIRSPDEITGLFTFPEAKQAAYAGTTLLILDRPDLVRRGITESERALALYQESAPADRSVGDILAARLDLVTAHVADESLDGAETELASVLATPVGQRTASIVRRSLTVSNELARPRYAASRQAIRIRRDIASFAAEGGRLMISGPTV